MIKDIRRFFGPNTDDEIIFTLFYDRSATLGEQISAAVMGAMFIAFIVFVVGAVGFVALMVIVIFWPIILPIAVIAAVMFVAGRIVKARSK